MRKFVITAAGIIITLSFILIIFLSTMGVKTDRFNSLINQKIKEINPKINFNLKNVSLKLNPINFNIDVVILNPDVAINKAKVEIESVKTNLNLIDYFNNRNPVSKITLISKENNIKDVVNFLNEYEFNLARSLILQQIKRGKVKISSNITLDDNYSDKFSYNINGSVRQAEFSTIKNINLNELKFNFSINKKSIDLNKIHFILNEIKMNSDSVKINRKNEELKIFGDLKSKKGKLNFYNYIKLINRDFDLLNDELISASSNNKFSFAISKKLKIKDINISSVINFDKLYSNKKYQEFIYLNDGSVNINYKDKNIIASLESNYMFLNKDYNNQKKKNTIKLNYQKKKNKKASVDLRINNSKNSINTNELSKLISLKNFSLPEQNILLDSENKITFQLSKKNQVENLKIKSKINANETLINYKSQRTKKYFKNFKNQIKLNNTQIDLDYNNKEYKIALRSEYVIDKINQNILLNISKNNKNYFFTADLGLSSSEVEINELDYIKKLNVDANLIIDGVYRQNKEIFFKTINYLEGNTKILIENIELGKNDKIKNLDLFQIDIESASGIRNQLEFKKVNDNYYLTGTQFDGTENIKNLLSNNSKSIFSNFKNLNSYIYLDIGKYYINKSSFLSKTNGEIQIKNSKVLNANISAKLNENRKFQLNVITNKRKEKITNLHVEKPEPFIKNFKFIKGFNEGELFYESVEFEGKSISNLKIKNFKVKEVPVLAKLLTLASLQGIADLLTGEGIRFSDFEMDYQKLGNTTNINELYAIGPAISLMMEGYIVKDNLTSLKGTLVPATTVNKTISKIPMLGEILVGKKIGEGVFGVSFKIKGPPKKLKTTVNPIKTLTPRFITRTLEKISD